VYNEPRSRFGGERAVVDATTRVLTENGHESRLLMKSSRSLEDSFFGRFCAFFGGVYNIRAYRLMRRLLEDDRPSTASTPCFRLPYWSPAAGPAFPS
jgi:hypothetical protein